MRHLFIIIATSLAFISCSDKIIAEGPITTEETNISASASAISVGSAMRLILSDDVMEGEIEIATNENIHRHIDVLEGDNKIKIQLEEHKKYKRLNIQITASAKQFSSIKASGASSVTINDVDLSVDSYNISLSGASRVVNNSTIYAKSCNISASGASSIEGPKFTTDDLIVKLSGASSLSMGVNKTISGNLSGASTLTYWGDATLSVESSGASKIQKISLD